MKRNRIHASRSGLLFVLGLLAVVLGLVAAMPSEGGRGSRFLRYAAPAGRLPATRHVTIDGLDAAVLPSGRLVTPAGVEVDEDFGTEPTGIRNHVNVPMEKVVRDNSDHLFPEFNTGIPDAPLARAPGRFSRFSRFGRFRQVFESQLVDRARGECLLPSYVDLYYPNDHGGGANDMFPDGSEPWSFTRFVQDNDDALGLTVDLISNSPCWQDTVIFVVEDDTQNGFDHVDAHRSIFLAIGPSIKPGYLLKTHASLSSIFKTVDLILDFPPLNLYDAAATDLLELFVDNPEDRSDESFDSQEIAFDTNRAEAWKAATKGIDFGAPDVDEVRLREAIRQTQFQETHEQSRKKAEGRFE